MLGGMRNKKREEELAAEVATLNARLAAQEEDFRLQQATLMDELNKVVRKADSLEASRASAALDTAFDESTDSGPDREAQLSARLSDANAKLQVAESRLAEVEVRVSESDAKTSLLSKTLSETEAKLRETEAKAETERSRLAGELASALSLARTTKEEAVSSAAFTKDDLEKMTAELQILKDQKGKLETTVKDLDARNQEILEEKARKHEEVKSLKNEIASINDKFRRKQESYVTLSREKENQYEEFKKRLDAVVEKKDGELELLHSQMSHLRLELKTVDQVKAERDSALTALAASASELGSLRSQAEGLGIQVQETHSANDVLSEQLKAAQADVKAMQEQMETAKEGASKRGELVREMEAVVERRSAQATAEVDKAKAQASALESRLHAEAESLNQRLSLAEAQLAQSLDKAQKEAERASEAESALEELRKEAEEMRGKRDEETLEKMTKLKEQMTGQIQELEAALDAAKEDGTRLMSELERVRMASQDHQAQNVALEKKQAPLLKDLKKQVQAEKKRADRLQEKCEELLAELQRSSSSFEELRASDCLDVPGKDNDNEFVCLPL